MRPFQTMAVGRSKHLSIILCRKQIYAIGASNCFKTHPLGKRFGYRWPTIHSEIDAITRCSIPPSQLQFFTLVNIRYMANGNAGMSKPCKYCQKLLTHFRFKEIYFTNNDGVMEKL